MKISAYAPINSLGYGIHSYNLLKALMNRGHKIALFPPFGRVEEGFVATAEWMLNRAEATNDDIGLMIFHEEFLRQFSGRKRVGFPVFELSEFNDIALAGMKSCDKILQPSHWGKSILLSRGISNVGVVPEGYNHKTFFPDRSDSQAIGMMQFRINFIHIGKMEKRKSTEDILMAFTRAITGEKKPTLLMMHVLNPFVRGWEMEFKTLAENLGWRSEGEQSSVYGVKAIRFTKEKSILDVPLAKYNSEHDLARLYNFFHFGIWASRAEGWNLPLLECCASGVPSFATPIGGQSEYVDINKWPDEFLFDHLDTEMANDQRFFFGDRGPWWKPSVDQMTEKLKVVLANPEIHYTHARKAILEQVAGFTWENSAIAFEKEMEGL